ncbi:MAG: hypothetical protein R3E42_07890 [Burkholderiaceae bacterium]
MAATNVNEKKLRDRTEIERHVDFWSLRREWFKAAAASFVAA